MRFHKPARNRTDVDPPYGRERREQGELGRGEGFIAQRHQQGDKGCRSHPAAQIFKEHRRRHAEHMLIGDGEQPVTGIRQPLQDAENHQGTEQA